MWVIFALLDPDPDSESGSGSTDLIESGSNPNLDPQPCYKDTAPKPLEKKIEPVGFYALRDQGRIYGILCS